MSYGDEIAQDYEFTERVGFAGRVHFGDTPLGSVEVSGSTFFLDTSILSESLGANRGRRSIAGGGISNTEDFSSFAFAIEGEDVPFAKDLRYHAAIIRQAPGVGDASDEVGMALGLQHRFAVTNWADLEPLAEFVWLDDFRGVKGSGRIYLTTAASLLFSSWNVSLTNTYRETWQRGGGNYGENLFEVSGGYRFGFGPQVQVGWRYLLLEAGDSQTVGLPAVYEF